MVRCELFMTKNNQLIRPTIAFLGDNLCNEFEGPIWNGAVQAAAKQNINLLGYAGGLLNFWYENSIFNLINIDRIDGIVVITGSLASQANEEELEQLYKHFLPLPVVSVSRPLEGALNMLVNNETGMRELVEHLIIDHHYRGMAFISGPKNNPEASVRLRIFRETLQRFGLPFDESHVFYGDFWTGGAEAIRIFMDERKIEFDAVVAANDYMAVYAMKELQRRGIKVPEEVAVVGFDDMRDARMVNPALTTVKQPLTELGSASIYSILSILEGKALEEVHLSTHLVVRQSCGCSMINDYAKPRAMAANHESQYTGGSDLDAAGGVFKILVTEFPQISEKMNNEDWALLFPELTIIESSEGKSGFLTALQQNIKQGFIAGIDIDIWFRVVRKILDVIEGSMDSPSELASLAKLGYDAFELIGTLAVKLQSAQQIKREEKLSAVLHFYHELNPAVNMDYIRQRLAENFSYLNIDSFYLARYNDNERKQARLFYFHSQTGHIELEDEEQTFPSNQLIPGHFSQVGGRYTFIVLPIMQIGFALYEIGASDEPFTEDIIVQVNTAIKLTSLMSEFCQYASELENEVAERTQQLRDVLNKLETSHAELQVKNDILADLVERDSLTGLYNHSAIHQRLEEIAEEQRRLKVPVSVLMLDVDNFKRFNDEYGHSVGDEILIKLSEILKSELQPDFRKQRKDTRLKCALRKYDVAGRYGGDEFAVILPYCGEEDVLKVAERFFRRIKSIRLPALDEIDITVSIGIAVANGETQCVDGKELLKLADKALYKSKHGGKDQFCIMKYKTK